MNEHEGDNPSHSATTPNSDTPWRLQGASIRLEFLVAAMERDMKIIPDKIEKMEDSKIADLYDHENAKTVGSRGISDSSGL